MSNSNGVVNVKPEFREAVKSKYWNALVDGLTNERAELSSPALRRVPPIRDEKSLT